MDSRLNSWISEAEAAKKSPYCECQRCILVVTDPDYWGISCGDQLFGLMDSTSNHFAGFQQLKKLAGGFFRHEFLNSTEQNLCPFLNRQTLSDARDQDYPSMAARHLFKLGVLSEKTISSFDIRSRIAEIAFLVWIAIGWTDTAGRRHRLWGTWRTGKSGNLYLFWRILNYKIESINNVAKKVTNT